MDFDPADHLWKSRLVVVFGGPKAIAEQRKLLPDIGVRERHLVIVEGSPELRRRWRVPASASVALIGKDGTLKATRKDRFTAKDLFGLIDAMPMRRSEMRRGG